MFSCRIYVYHMYVFYFSDKYVAFKSFLCVCLSSVCCFLIDLICVYLSYTCMCAQSGRWFHAGYIVAHTSQAQFLGLADSTTLFGGANGTATRLQYKPDNVCVYVYVYIYVHIFMHFLVALMALLLVFSTSRTMCVCVFVYTYVHIHIYIHMYVHSVVAPKATRHQYKPKVYVCVCAYV